MQVMIYVEKLAPAWWTFRISVPFSGIKPSFQAPLFIFRECLYSKLSIYNSNNGIRHNENKIISLFLLVSSLKSLWDLFLCFKASCCWGSSKGLAETTGSLVFHSHNLGGVCLALRTSSTASLCSHYGSLPCSLIE